MSRKHLAGYKALLKDAVAAGELTLHDTTRMARAQDCQTPKTKKKMLPRGSWEFRLGS